MTAARGAQIVGQEIVAGERCAVVDLGDDWNGQLIVASEGDSVVRRVIIPMTLVDDERTLITIPEIQFRLGPSVRSQVVVTYEPEIHALEPVDFQEDG